MTVSLEVRMISIEDTYRFLLPFYLTTDLVAILYNCGFIELINQSLSYLKMPLTAEGLGKNT